MRICPAPRRLVAFFAAFLGFCPSIARAACSDGLLGLVDSVTIGEQPVLTGTVQTTSATPPCALPLLPTLPTPGTGSMTVNWGSTGTIDTSFHGSVLVHSGSTLLLKPGSYRIAGLVVEWGAYVRVDTSDGVGADTTHPGVLLAVQGDVAFYDGATLQYPGLSDSLAASRMALVVPGVQTISLSSGTNLRAQVIAPQAMLAVVDRVQLTGRFLVHKAVIGANFTGRFAASGIAFPWDSATVVAISGSRRFWTNATSVSVSWTVNGVEHTAQLTETLRTTDGTHWIKRCSAGSCDSVQALVDRTAPVIAIQSPASGTLVKTPRVELLWTVDGVAQVDSQTLVEGSNVVIRTATDSTGNVGSASVLVRLDTQAPVVQILSPHEGDTVNSATVAVTWSADGVSSTDAAALVPGLNTITRTSTDSVGNIGSASIQVFFRQGGGALVAVASAPATAFAYTNVLVTADSSTVPMGVTPIFGLRQIAGSEVRVVADGARFQFLARDPAILIFEMSLDDSAGALTGVKDTLTIQIREPVTFWEQLQVLEQSRDLSDGDHTISITGPSQEWSFAVTKDAVAMTGLVELDTTARRIDWSSSAFGSGYFQSASEEWLHPKLAVATGDQFVRYFYSDDSGNLAVAQAMITHHDSLRVTDFQVTPEQFFSDQMLTHQVRVRGRFDSRIASLELVQITPTGVRTVTTLNDAGYGSDTLAGDSIWSGTFQYQADSGESVYLRLQSAYASGVFESQVRSFYSQPEVTADDVALVVEINDSAGALFGRVDSLYGPEIARDSVLAWLLVQHQVQDAGIAPDGFSVSWVSKSGVNAVIASAPEGTMGAPDPIPVQAFGIYLDSIFDPNPAIQMNSVMSSWKIQEPARWSVDPLPAYTEFENDLLHWASWSQRKATFTVSHGGVWGIESRNRKTMGVGVPIRGNVTGTFVYSGNHSEAIRAAATAMNGFSPAAKGGVPQLVLFTEKSQRTQIGLTSEFFRLNYRAGLNGTLFYSGACQGTREFGANNKRLKNSFPGEMKKTRLGGDRNAFVGFTSWVSGEAVRVAGSRLLHYLHKGVTLSQAMDSLYIDPILNQTSGVRQNQSGHYLEWVGNRTGYGTFVSALRFFGDGSFSLSPQVKAAGNNTYGQLGTGTTAPSNDLASVLTSGNVISVAPSHAASAGLLYNGKVLSWGSNNNDELGSNATATTGLRLVPDTVLYISAGVVQPLPNIVSLKGANFGHGADNLLLEGRFIALDNAGKVWTWGKNNLGQTGLPSTIRANRARVISFGSGRVAQTIEAGGRHGIALLSDGSVGTFGYGYTLGQGDESVNGQFVPRAQGIGRVVHRNPDGTCPEMDTPSRILNGAVAVGAGANVSFAITADDRVYGWGNNYSGEAGIDTWMAGKYCAWEIGTLSGKGLTSIAGGTSHTLGLDVNGRVWAWGSNEYGAIGLGGFGGVFLPTQVELPSTIVKISAGDDVSAALDLDGNVYVWGKNDQGQLGLGDLDNVGAPVQLPGLYRDIAVGTAHILAIPLDREPDQ